MRFTAAAFEAAVLPIVRIRIIYFAEDERLELPSGFRNPRRHSRPRPYQLGLILNVSPGDKDRTCDSLRMKEPLYQLTS